MESQPEQTNGKTPPVLLSRRWPAFRKPASRQRQSQRLQWGLCAKRLVSPAEQRVRQQRDPYAELSSAVPIDGRAATLGGAWPVPSSIAAAPRLLWARSSAAYAPVFSTPSNISPCGHLLDAGGTNPPVPSAAATGRFSGAITVHVPDMALSFLAAIDRHRRGLLLRCDL